MLSLIKLKLIQAKELLRDVGWCKGDFAKDSNGECTRVGAGSDCAYCAYGVLMKVECGQLLLPVLSRLNSNLPPRLETGIITSIIQYNDLLTTTLEDILALFDRAIESIDLEMRHK